MSKVSLAGPVRKAGVLLVALVLALALAPQACSWGTSTHHDQGPLLHKALRETPSIPAEVREKIDFDTIYAGSTAPDDWRAARRAVLDYYPGYDIIPTYQTNMMENAAVEFQRIRDALEIGDYDNAVFRTGSALHYVGDAIVMCHNENVQRYYRENIEPLGSTVPLWASEESGGDLWPHYGHQQIEAYSDTDSAWYPTRPENYGPGDDGSLDWYIENYFRPLMLDYIENVVNPYLSDGEPKESSSPDNNRWFYWVRTRDCTIAKMDYDNSTRLAYNGVYRALRDGYIAELGHSESDWPWPLTTGLVPRPYGNGMDTIRWYQGIASGQSGVGMLEQGAVPYEVPGVEGAEASPLPSALLAVGLTLLVLSLWCARRSR